MRQENGPIKAKYKHIPTELTKKQAEEFVLPHLSTPKRGPNCSVPLYRIFNYLLKFLHTGTQWYQLPIQCKENGDPEIHYTRVFRIYQRWCRDGSLEKVFENTVALLNKKKST